MSQITNVVTTQFRAYGGHAVAAMGQVAGGMKQIGSAINQTTRQSEYFGQQWRAIGTTVRYALAGGVIFGLKGVVTQLKEVQVQMGLISAIGSIQGPTGLATSIVGKDLQNLMAQARMGAVESITPLTDFNNAIINILSTVGTIPQNQIVPIATEIAKASKLAQINAEDATKAFTTMSTAFGQPANMENIKRTAQEFFVLTKEAPGGVPAGQQIITQLGQLAAVTKLAGGTQEDIFSLYLTGLRGGIPPAQLGRGLQFAVQTLALPGQQSKASEAALRKVGIRPGVEMTLQERLARVFNEARSRGLGGDIGKLRDLNDATIASFGGDEAEVTPDMMRKMGLSSKGAEFFGQAFPRIHALRAIAAISTQIETGQAKRDFEVMERARDGQIEDINNLAKAWDKFSDQAKLQAATVAISAMGQQVATIFAPVLNFMADQVVSGSKFLAGHPGGTRTAVTAGVAGATTLAALRFAGVTLGSFGKGATRAQAGLAFATGGGNRTVMDGLGNSPGDPIFVSVVNDLFGGTPGGGPGTPVIVPGGEGAGKPKGKIRKLPVWARGAGGVAGAVGLSYVADNAIRDTMEKVDKQGWGHYFFGDAAGPLGSAAHAIGSPFTGKSKVERISDKMLEMRRAEQIHNAYNLRNPFHITDIFSKALTNINGKAHVTLDVNVIRPGGKIDRTTLNFPLDLYGRGTYPTTRGNKNGTRK